MWNKVLRCCLYVVIVFHMQCFCTANTPPAQTKVCEYYNSTACNDKSCEGLVDECPREPDKHNHCFVLWHIDNTTGSGSIRMKGCFMGTQPCANKDDCVDRSHSPKNSLGYCCCEGDLCNRNYSWIPGTTVATPLMGPVPMPNESPVLHIFLYSLIVVAIIVLSFVTFVWVYRHKKLALFHELPTPETHPLAPPSPTVGLRPIQLLEVKASGRFGSVWRAMCKDEEIAVKIFPVHDQNSWLAEQEIYKLPNIAHPDILQYMGVEKRGDNLQAEFWMITAYHHRGSLCDYLKAHTVTWAEMAKIAESMARGLTHLHDEIPSLKGLSKPAVAHRDFKSKNVLLKHDMSACIADFGLALIFQPGEPCGDTHGQVGTRRYMAPEVLEGAINFTRDAFLRIDMYACGLVLWELASRCSDQEGNVPEYKLPFEAEIGTHPSLEEMQEAVVTKKLRPTLADHWRRHSGLSAMSDTMEECWDHDAEARLSASCVMERVSLLTRYTTTQSNGLIIETNNKPSLV